MSTVLPHCFRWLHAASLSTAHGLVVVATFPFSIIIHHAMCGFPT